MSSIVTGPYFTLPRMRITPSVRNRRTSSAFCKPCPNPQPHSAFGTLEHTGILRLATDNRQLATVLMNYIYGINAVTEALKARGRAFQWVGMAKERNDIRLQRMIEDCRRLGVPVKFLTRTELDQMAGRAAHQGVVADPLE